MITTRPKHRSFELKKSSVLTNTLLIAIDCGIAITKVIYLHKEDSKQLYDVKCEYITLQYVISDNDEFEDAIRLVSDNSHIPTNCSDKVHVTGSMGYTRMGVIKSILGLELIYIDESLALIAGLRYGLEEIGFDNLLANNVNVESLGEIIGTSKQRLFETMKKKLEKNDQSTIETKSLIYPCLVQVCGSVSKLVYFNESGKGEVIKCQSIGGQTMLGIGKCLFDVNDYDEIMKLASTGNRANVDTQIKDILRDDKKSPYGKYPPETALFPFGKSMDFNTGMEDYSRADVAASLVAFYSILTIMEYFHMCTLKSVKKVYLTGNIFRCDAFQREIKGFLFLLPPIFEMKMLDFGYSRSLGAMICSNDDVDEYCIQKDK